MVTHFIIIGFKSAGKTTFGKKLSKISNLPFIDLDRQIGLLYQQKNRQKCSSRQIARLYGEKFFRKMEYVALKKVLKKAKTLVIATGGGACFPRQNQKLLQPHCIIHVFMPKKIVFKRIKMAGRPAFFTQNKNMYSVFDELWKARMPIYKKLANITIKLLS